MLLLKSTSHDPYWNIATEEYLLKNRKEDILFFYRNTPAVIIGKHQIHNLEVNIPYSNKEQIPVIRRTSGGGSVFHDTNNINYCILTSSEKAWVDFKNFTQPLTDYLIKMGEAPELRSKSDIRLRGKKISGNASHIFKNRVLHHGSILFATDLTKLTEALKNKPSCYHKKTVQSRRSIVTNLASSLKTPISVETFESNFIQSLYQKGFITNEFELLEKEKAAICQLVKEKYSTTAWNVLYNANYRFENTFLHKNEMVHLSFEVRKGICQKIKTNSRLLKENQKLIENVPHETSAFLTQLAPFFSKWEILTYFF